MRTNKQISKHNYYLKNKEKLSTKRKERYRQNRDKEILGMKKWYGKNKDKRKVYTKKYRVEKRKLFEEYKNFYRFGGQKNIVLERDKYTCQSCGNSKKLIIHHIDGSGARRERKIDIQKTNNSLENLITLCESCHFRLHRWQESNCYICESIHDIVRTMAKVIEEYNKLPPRKRGRNK